MVLRRTVALIASLVVGGALMAGCSQDAGDSSSAPTKAKNDPVLAQFADEACKEGHLTVYASAADATMNQYLDAFKQAYPCIQTDYFRAAGTALLTRFESEAKAGSVAADVFLPTIEPSFIEDHPQWFLKLTDSVMPKAKQWPKKFRTDYTVSSVVEEIVAIYNKNNVKNPPKNWSDVTGSQYSGRVMLTDPKASPSYMSWYEIMDKKYGDDFLKKLSSLKAGWVSTGATSAQQVATGSKDLAIPTYPSHATTLLSQGAPVGLVRNMDPTMGITTMTAITAKAPHPAAAKLFANWMLTKAGFDAVCKDGVFSAVISGTSCRTLASNYVAPVWDIPQAEQNRIVRLLGR